MAHPKGGHGHGGKRVFYNPKAQLDPGQFQDLRRAYPSYPGGNSTAKDKRRTLGR